MKQIADLTDSEFIDRLHDYLSILQEGRIKPNKNSSPKGDEDSTVRDSIDNFGDIHGAKKRLNEIYGIDQKYVDKLNKSKRI